MSFIKIDICTAAPFRPNVCGRQGKRLCKQHKQRQQGKNICTYSAARHVNAPPRACFYCKALLAIAVVVVGFFFFWKL